MVTLTDLLFPILTSTVLLFIASFLLWAVSPHHKPEIQSLGANEDGLIQVLRQFGVKPGRYMFPYADNPSDPDYKKKLEGGCLGVLTLFKGPPNMGRNMAMTIFGFAMISLFIGYVASNSRLEPGARYFDVFQLTGAMGFAICAFGGWSEGVWFGKSARGFVTNTIDALIYGLLAGGCFAGLWPAAAGAAEAVGG
ncbi:MAG: hypothetical protein AAGJ54_09690 [Planctomycetota bacterium]